MQLTLCVILHNKRTAITRLTSEKLWQLPFDMSGISQHQTIFRVAKRIAADSGTQPQKAKRNRQTISCLPCRDRKFVFCGTMHLTTDRSYCSHRLKCDRQVPCLSCSKRGDETSCAYFTSGVNGRDRRGGEPRDSEAQLRLQKLEEMVTSLMRTTKENLEGRRDEMSIQFGNADQRFNDPSPTGSDPSSELQLDSNVPERNYVSATHWTAILENVCVPSHRMLPTYS